MFSTVFDLLVFLETAETIFVGENASVQGLGLVQAFWGKSAARWVTDKARHSVFLCREAERKQADGDTVLGYVSARTGRCIWTEVRREALRVWAEGRCV